MNRFFIIIFLISLTAFSKVSAQGSNQVVKVIKPYEPVINDAYKISELPKIVDTNKVITKFEYEIIPKKYNTGFEPKPIKPARLISEPLSKLYMGQAKLGFGSYLSPLAQVYLGSKRSEQWNWNLMAHHNSSNGKIKNEVGEKVYAGLSNTKFDGNLNYFTKKEKVFRLSADYANSVNYFYGYNPDMIIPGEEPPLLKDSIESRGVNFFKTKAEWQTNYLDSSHVNYNIDVNWQRLSDNEGISENVLNINTGLNYFFESEFVGVDVNLQHYAQDGIRDSSDGFLVKFSPWIGAFGNRWRVVAGVSTFYDQMNEVYHFYPRLSMHYNVIDYFLIPYFELNGNYRVNSYKDIYDENHFITQTLGVLPTDTKVDMTFGFRGNISSKVAFNAKVNYMMVDNQYFFVNDTSLRLQNKFNVVYDDMSRVRILGELSYKTSDKLLLSAKANYYSYSLDSMQYAWHKPDFTLSLSARYVIQKKIVLNANVYALSSRYVREFDSTGKEQAKELQGVVDLNLGVEYRLSKIFSAFAYFNNLSSVKYYEWNHYPSQRFNVMLGVSYTF